MSEIFCFHCGAAHAKASGFCQACGHPLLLNKRYHILGQLGAGGFGEVYRAEDMLARQRLVALKRLSVSSIPPEKQQEALEAFRREGHMLATLKHSNFPAWYGQFVEQGDAYLVLEFLAGETLQQRMERRGTHLLPIALVIHFGMELATVLDYLHTRQPPVIFRDLKPTNIMVMPDNRVYLIDFGIARRFQQGEKKHTENLGTPGYASPEHYSLVTPLSDIYSLGAILHELLSGEDPASHGLFQYPELHLQGAPEARLAALVMRMVQKNAQGRPQSALQVKHELQALLQALQPASPAPSRSAVVTQVSSPMQRLPPLLRPSRPLKMGELYYAYSHTSSTIRALAWSPNGQYLAALGEKPPHVLIWKALSQQLVLTLRFADQIQALAWSPNGQRIAVAGNDRTVSIWTLTGKRVKTYTGHKGTVQALSWSSRDHLIISGDANKELHLWNAVTGWRLHTYQNHQSEILTAAFSPDGKQFASSDNSRNLYVYRFVRGLEVLTRGPWHHASCLSPVTALAWSPKGDEVVYGGDRRGHLDIHSAIYPPPITSRWVVYAGHTSRINAVTWSPTGKLIASSSEEGTVHLWDATQQYERHAKHVFIYRGHTEEVKALVWSPSGAQIASAGFDAQIHVWHATFWP